GFVCRGDAPLALAVVAFAPRLDDARRSDALDSGGEFAVVIDRSVRRGTSTKLLDEALLAQPILRHFQRVGAGSEAVRGNRGERRHGNVLEFVSHDRATLRELAQRFAVVPVGAGEAGADFGGD